MSSLFISYLQSDPWYFFSWIIIVVFSICLHEYAHAIVALHFGDDTAAASGHLTLNPLVQMGPLSMVVLLVCGIAWGSVPINPARLSRGEMGWVAMAGPLANVFLCVVAGLLAAFCLSSFFGDSPPLKAATLLQNACLVNGVLFVFNMLPVPMLDGWKVLGMVDRRVYEVSDETASMITMIFFMVVFIGPAGSLVWKYGGELAGAILTACLGLFRLLGLV